MQSLAPRLVVVAIVTVFVGLKSVRSLVPPLQAAEGSLTPTTYAVQASTGFATALYRHLAQDKAGLNLFFSPYSLFSALVMTAEGARGETARQMGTVLRFPEAVRNGGGNADSLPWNTAVIQTGMAALRQRLRGGAASDAAQTQAIRKQIVQLEQEHQSLTTQLKQLQAEEQRAQWSEVSQRAAAVASELNTLRQQIDQYELHIANALWGEQTFPFRPQFIAALHDAYDAAATPVDFLHDAEAARGRINQWVAEQTRQRITNLLAPGTLTPATRLVLTNAIYFKGRWAEAFDQQDTQEADFTRTDGTTAKAMFMATRDAAYRYAELWPDDTRNELVFDQARFKYELQPNPDGFQLLELPYRGHTLAMVVVLPKRHDGLAALEDRLTVDTLSTWLEALRTQNVQVYLPRFTLETTYDLPPALSAMGMPAAFEPGGFTGLSEAPEARTLALSAVVHKAFVEVNEEGTEAAAATAVTAVATAARLEPPIPTFRADRPFLFLIRDSQSDTILFLGRMVNPYDAT